MRSKIRYDKIKKRRDEMKWNNNTRLERFIAYLQTLETKSDVSLLQSFVGVAQSNRVDAAKDNAFGDDHQGVYQLWRTLVLGSHDLLGEVLGECCDGARREFELDAWRARSGGA